MVDLARFEAETRQRTAQDVARHIVAKARDRGLNTTIRAASESGGDGLLVGARSAAPHNQRPWIAWRLLVGNANGMLTHRVDAQVAVDIDEDTLATLIDKLLGISPSVR